MKLLLVILFTALVSPAIAYNTNYQELAQEIHAQRSTRAVPVTAPQLIARNGYTAETHTVTTEDGYILEMHRIPATPTSPAARDKHVVFIMHGLFSSSADWIVMGPEKGLAYLLADAGYDVWMGNARGNTYSKKHTTITDTSGSDFWKFSWHEIGIYDLPAMIDFALGRTGQKQVIYIGHSQGTTSFYVMTSEIPEYNEKIKVMFSLAPVAYMGHVKSPLLRFGSRIVNTLSFLFKLFGINEFLPNTNLLRSIGANFCRDDDITQVLCTNALFVLCGFNQAEMNRTALPAIFAHTPAGASSRQLAHYGQEIRSHKFRQFDLGWIKNRIYYGGWTPPKYDLGKVTAPVHLVYSDNDWMASVKDVTQLYNELGNPREMVRVLDGKWNHLDFLWGIDAKRLVYNDILATLRKSYSR